MAMYNVIVVQYYMLIRTCRLPTDEEKVPQYICMSSVVIYNKTLTIISCETFLFPLIYSGAQRVPQS